MRKLWLIFIAIFVFSFAILGWVGTEIFRQAPPIPREVVTTEGQVLIAAEEISNGQNVWQAMGGMESGSIWGHGSYVAPDWSADYLHREALFILNNWSAPTLLKIISNTTLMFLLTAKPYMPFNVTRKQTL
jgi:nitric oxide reductase subunit B